VEDAEVVLRRAPLFEGLDEESARALRRQMLDVKLSRGEHLFLEGQDGDRLYVVMDGKLKLTRAAAGGRENGWPKLKLGRSEVSWVISEPRQLGARPDLKKPTALRGAVGGWDCESSDRIKGCDGTSEQ